MDGQRFDRLTQQFGWALSRRRFGAMLAGLLTPILSQDAAGKRGRDRQRGARDRRRKPRAGGGTQAEAACFTGSPCIPGPGKNLGKCDFGGSFALRNTNLTGANLGGTNLRGADASGANFKGANLNKACLIDADLTGARINGSTNTGGAVFCRTTMPDGSTNDSGCNKGTRCCPTCIAVGETCGDGSGGECCDGAGCVNGVCAPCRDDNAFACGTSGGGCGPACADDEACVDGACVSCADACPGEGCNTCLRLVDGSTTCASLFSLVNCPVCDATDPCSGDDVCALGGVVKETGQTFNFEGTCDLPPGTAVCVTPTDCCLDLNQACEPSGPPCCVGICSDIFVCESF